MKAQHTSGKIFDITGSCYFREDEKLLLAVSYLDGEETKTISFPVNEETGEITHDDYILINE